MSDQSMSGGLGVPECFGFPISTHPNDDAAGRMAELWYTQHLAEHLSPDHALAAKRCAAYLQGEGVEARRAQTIALQALGRFEHGNRFENAYIDLARTTSYTVFLVDPGTGWEYAITAVSLANHARCAIDSAPHVLSQHPVPPGAQA